MFQRLTGTCALRGPQGGENIFHNIVDSVKSVANRFTAPVSGDEHTDKAAVDKVTGKADEAHYAARDKVAMLTEQRLHAAVVHTVSIFRLSSLMRSDLVCVAAG